jgi:hypothetical protein
MVEVKYRFVLQTENHLSGLFCHFTEIIDHANKFIDSMVYLLLPVLLEIVVKIAMRDALSFAVLSMHA